MSKHTPGPWTFHGDDSYMEITSINPLDGGLYIYREGDFSRADVSIADGKLIAAAPELLEILKEAAWRYTEDTDSMNCTWCGTSSDAHLARCKVANVIAKAEGRQ